MLSLSSIFLFVSQKNLSHKDGLEPTKRMHHLEVKKKSGKGCVVQKFKRCLKKVYHLKIEKIGNNTPTKFC